MRNTLIHYTKSQRIEILLFFTLLFALQSLYFFMDFGSGANKNKDKELWLSQKGTIDSLKLYKRQYKPTIHPFNPNFITDYKGYKLGMTVVEIDRLIAFRKQNKFVNSAAEFQAVTRVSDSLLSAIAPYFKFPEWVKNKRNDFQSFPKKDFSKSKIITVLDINTATKEDLMKINGIGDKISDRILNEKEKYGGFVSMQQMNDIWGLSPDVLDKLNTHFEVKSITGIKRININSASIKELSQFPFFRYALAKNIVIYRSMNGDIKIEDLSKIKDFPVDKIKIIALYLEF